MQLVSVFSANALFLAKRDTGKRKMLNGNENGIPLPDRQTDRQTDPLLLKKKHIPFFGVHESFYVISYGIT